MHTTQNEKVSGNAGIAQVVPVERRHAQVKPHLLLQESDVGGDEGDEERRPRDRAINPSGADRATALDLKRRPALPRSRC
jgi:hypothetical protein